MLWSLVNITRPKTIGGIVSWVGSESICEGTTKDGYTPKVKKIYIKAFPNSGIPLDVWEIPNTHSGMPV